MLPAASPVAVGGPTEGPTLSIVVPMHGEAANLPALFARLEAVLDRLGCSSEVICVDDGSTDATWAGVIAAAARNPRIRGLRFSRNFGKEMAMTAGLRQAGGRAVVLMDADLQHPPELIETFVARWRDGAETVFAQRCDRAGDPRLRRWLTRLYYRVLGRLSEVDLQPGAGDFRLMDRAVVDALNALPERSRFMKGLYGWVGFRQEAIPFSPDPRSQGQSRFGFARLVRLGLDGLVSFSVLPLRIWSLLGMAVAAGAVVYGGVIVARTLATGVDVPGYASLMVATLFLGGIQLICLGVLGEYLGRVFTEVKGRPPYIVAATVGFDRDRRPAEPPGPVFADNLRQPP